MTKEEILSEKYNIDEQTIGHNYQYLYRSVISAMDDYAKEYVKGLLPSDAEISEFPIYAMRYNDADVITTLRIQNRKSAIAVKDFISSKLTEEGK